VTGLSSRKSDRARGGTRHGRTAVVVGVVGLVLGATGGAHAATLVTGKQIKDGTVTGADVRNGTIAGPDVADGSITPDDFAGPAIGRDGPRGEQGPTGAPGLRVVTFAGSPTYEPAPGEIVTAIAVCPEGLVAMGGGARTHVGNRLQVLESAPLSVDPSERRAWITRVRNNTTIKVYTHTFAVCVEVR